MRFYILSVLKCISSSMISILNNFCLIFATMCVPHLSAMSLINVFFLYQLQCCGGQGYNDYIDSYWMNKNEKHKDQVPLSCCRDYRANESPGINSVGCSINSRDDNLIHKRVIFFFFFFVKECCLELFW